MNERGILLIFEYWNGIVLVWTLPCALSSFILQQSAAPP